MSFIWIRRRYVVTGRAHVLLNFNANFDHIRMPEISIARPGHAFGGVKNPLLSHDPFCPPSLTHPSLAAVNPAALINNVPSINSASFNSVPAKVPAGVLAKWEAYSLRVLCNLQR